MKTIHKFEVPIVEKAVSLRLCDSAKVRMVEYITCAKSIFMWVEVPADEALQNNGSERLFRVFLSGSGIPAGAVFVGSAVDQYHPEAYHLYEITGCVESK
ncbi:MAG: hypothetical protein JKY01_08205 [Pseudomonadales bacterium]|nr:hypothetical protein [Pseudomonadales bacterium]